MKRIVVVIALIASVVGSGAAAARPYSGHLSTTQQYVAGGIADIAPDGNTGFAIGDNVGAVTFEGSAARSVNVKIVDQGGQAIMAVVSQGDKALTEICGATDSPIKVRPSLPIRVWLFNGQCGGGTSLVTTGTVTLTFGNHR
jgi:hypothetical protein